MNICFLLHEIYNKQRVNQILYLLIHNEIKIDKYYHASDNQTQRRKDSSTEKLANVLYYCNS